MSRWPLCPHGDGLLGACQHAVDVPAYPKGDDALVVHPQMPSRWAFVCVCVGCKNGNCDGLPTQPCERTQSYAPADRQGGVTVKEAKGLGWRKTERGWVCPLCSGDDAGLRKVWKGAGKKRSR